MSHAVTLEEKIVAALTGACTSDHAEGVLAEAQKVFADLVKHADAADIASLNPLATSTEAHALRRSASDQRFDADRMEASVSALGARVADLRDAEQSEREKVARDAVIQVRDKLAAEIAAEYPGIVARLTDFAKRIMECDELCRQHRIKESAEAVGRGIPPGFYENNGPIPRIIDVKLPMPQGGRIAWEHHPDGWHFRGLDILTPPHVVGEVRS